MKKEKNFISVNNEPGAVPVQEFDGCCVQKKFRSLQRGVCIGFLLLLCCLYTSVAVKEFAYGDKLTADVIQEKAGYTVTFLDWDGEILKQDIVGYGEAAEAPEIGEPAGKQKAAVSNYRKKCKDNRFESFLWLQILKDD